MAAGASAGTRIKPSGWRRRSEAIRPAAALGVVIDVVRWMRLIRDPDQADRMMGRRLIRPDRKGRRRRILMGIRMEHEIAIRVDRRGRGARQAGLRLAGRPMGRDGAGLAGW